MNLPANLYEEGELFFFFTIALHSKGKRGRSLTAQSGNFLSSFLVDMAFSFTGPPECTLVQRGGERESKTVHVKLPWQQGGKK